MNEQVKEAKRIVTLQDGSTADFGKRNTVLQSVDTEVGTITYKVFSGEVLTLDLNEVPFGSLVFSEQSDFVKKILAYGITCKIKTGLAGVSVEDTTVDGAIIHPIADSIKSSIENVKEGVFNTRNGGASEEGELEDSIKYFAVAAGTFKAYPFYNEELAGLVKKEDNLILFNSEADGALIGKVISIWENLSQKEKNAAKRDQHFKFIEGQHLQHLIAQAAV